eukprot:CAMPEP_0174350466 /NCGR_PEP_ID=MMETSP0811_2-20130205/7562_1 /TAXON_ID=73025 ORGANISM="Eutreptiella gymnastica-like, Strain CCMP1594" /NCGR_SAMPLE_ID=MMETSP0811_2 /ASSEMBLY_ACC=CAM_ASM_000667 /LENGTH=73 /DNA_ID=CAMNT_0015478815 /DNA_START=647 /DNA_END=869 /DNA_ORIENTATION=+
MGAAGSRRWGAAHQYGSVKGMAFDAFGGVFLCGTDQGGDEGPMAEHAGPDGPSCAGHWDLAQGSGQVIWLCIG